MTEFTKQQLKLIEKHRDWNTDHDWWESTIEDFVDVLAAFGITIDTRARPGQSYALASEPKIYWDLYHRTMEFSTQWCNMWAVYREGSETIRKGTYGEPENFSGYVKVCYELYKAIETALGVGVLLEDIQGCACDNRFQFLNGSFARDDESEMCYNNAVDLALTDEEDIEAKFGDPVTDDERAEWEQAQPLKPIVLALADCFSTVEDTYQELCSALLKVLDDEYEYLQSDEAIWETLEANDMTGDLDVEDND